MSKVLTTSRNQLPTEVLSIIADALDASNIYSCLQVCRVWHEPFRRALYRQVHIHNSAQFIQFTVTLDACKARGVPAHNPVKELYLSPSLSISDKEMMHLISYMPNLNILSHDSTSWDYLHRMQVLSSKCDDDDLSPSMYYATPRKMYQNESRLTHLHLPAKRIAEFLKQDNKLFSSVTHLIVGDYENREDGVLPRLTLKEILAIHRIMPHLAHFRLINLNMEWPQRGNPFEGQQPIAAGMRTISFEDVEVDNHRWLSFWCDMYPNIEALRFMFRRGGSLDMDGYSRRAFMRMAKEFKSLKKYDISFYGHHIFGLSVLDISTIFQYNCTALEDINVFLPNSYETKQIKDTTIYRYQKSLVKLQIALENQVLDHDRILRPLITSCVNLKDLSLGYYGDNYVAKESMPVFEINTFLKYCPQLLNLKLQNVNVKVSDDSRTTTLPLTSLSMTSVCATRALLQFVEQQCPALKNIRLKRCKLLESDTSNREITISTSGKDSDKNDLLQISDTMGLSLSYTPKKSASYNTVVELYKQYLQVANAIDCLG